MTAKTHLMSALIASLTLQIANNNRKMIDAAMRKMDMIMVIAAPFPRVSSSNLDRARSL
jgi:hypothetical protein